ncbi:hypothetical protein B296_00051730 [Ensete ventricosum]|uniref:Uncharacterized protein n=1 Tax=Ensete ventricosum TaxID=4639 RepID=A0A426XM49_ENSVE|nr:hypothetical protein B296_00051730 [Ensete ventricosum]
MPLIPLVYACVRSLRGRRCKRETNGTAEKIAKVAGNLDGRKRRYGDYNIRSRGCSIYVAKLKKTLTTPKDHETTTVTRKEQQSHAIVQQRGYHSRRGGHHGYSGL